MGITPIGVQKRIKDLIDGVYDADEGKKQLRAAQTRAKYESMPEKDMERELKRLEKEMLDAAKNLEFEKAAQLRDRLCRAEGGDVRRGAAGRDLTRSARLAARAYLPAALRFATSRSRYFHENPNCEWPVALHPRVEQRVADAERVQHHRHVGLRRSPTSCARARCAPGPTACAGTARTRRRSRRWSNCDGLVSSGDLLHSVCRIW